MSLYILLPSVVIGLAFPAYAPEASDSASPPAREIKQKSVSVAARKQALNNLLVAAGLLRRSNDTKKVIQTLNEAGRLQLGLFLNKEALATFQQSDDLLDQNTDPFTTVDTLNLLASAYVAVNNYDAALPHLMQARTISEQNNYAAGKAEALLLLSKCQNEKNHAEALNTAGEALQLWQGISDDRGAARTHVAIGLYHFAQWNLVEAGQEFQSALDLATRLGDPPLQAESIVYLGFVESRKGAWQESFSLMTRAAELIDGEAEPYLMGRISAGFAESFIETGLPEVGLQKYQEALEYYRQTNVPRPLVSASWGIGKAQFILKNYPEALITLQQTLAAAENKFPNWVAQSHDYLGRTYAKMDQPEQALEHFETALPLYETLDNPMEAACVRALIGQLYQTQGKLDKAQEFYQQALEKFVALKDRIDQSATLFALGQLEMKRGNYDIAETYLRQSLETTEDVRSQTTTRDLTAAFSATVHDRYVQYIQCLMRRNDRQAAVQAFEISESARARSLAEFLRSSETNLLTRWDPALADQEKSLRHSMRAKGDYRVTLVSKPKYEKAAVEKLDAELAQLEEQYKSVVATISRRYPAFEQITQPRGWNLARIQNEVIKDDDTLLLEYIIGADKSYVWAITRNSFNSHEITGAVDKVAETVYNLSKERSNDGDETQLTQASQTLSQMLLSPVANELNKRRLIVIADGTLNYIPFQMLLSPSSSSEPLVAEHVIINAPSASILGELREEAAGRGARAKVLAAFGNPALASSAQNGNKEHIAADEDLRYALRDIELNGDSFDLSKIGQLFFAEREINNLREIATPGATFAVTGFAANRDQLFKMDLSQFAILHFATHGLLDPKRPEYSGILLSMVDDQGKQQKGFITLQDVYSLRAPVDLVVLSACRTGLGKDIRGEGLVGLTRGFMYAGATTVVASLWKVDDEATSELMKRFYSEMLQNHKTPDEALRIAQDSIRHRPGWSAPHYWAGFTLQGEYQYVVNSERSWKRYASLLVIGIFVIVLVSVAGWYRYRVRSTSPASK